MIPTPFAFVAVGTRAVHQHVHAAAETLRASTVWDPLVSRVRAPRADPDPLSVSRQGVRPAWWQLLLVVGLPLIAFVGPAAAAPSSSGPICSAAKLPGIIEGFFQITTAIGIMGLVVVWQIDVIVEIFTPDPDQRRAIKQHRRTAGKSAAIVTALGPLYTVAGSLMSLPLADCVNLAPW